jgi:hypothetical protein
MSNKLSAVLILCMSTMCLAGCDLLRVAGPCYGVGCPGGTAGHSGQYKPSEAPKAQNSSAPAPARTALAPAPSANAPAQTASASTTAQSAATQSPATASTTAQATTAQSPDAQTAPQPASPQAKPSPLHAIGEFFAHLIPHHNSGAKSGAAD